MWPFSDPYPVATLESIAGQKFDYIVVGGGTAGCVVASRLSEQKDATVLLLERGPVLNTWASRIPLLSTNFHLATSPSYKWAGAPLSSITDLGKSSFNMVSGRVLGGTSKINAHLYTRSVPGEYNAWAAAGRQGWAWEDVEPFFNKSENSLTHGKSPHRGASGPWENQRIEPIHFQNVQESINAATELGIPFSDAANDPSAPAALCFRADHTIDQYSRRLSCFDAFLPPHVWQRPNLTVCAEVIVDCIDFEETPEGPRAAGVRVEYDDLAKANKSFYIAARHEIILSGGAIASPQVLMLSGIGPKDDLTNNDITVIKDLPGVGSHLQDHVAVSMVYTVPRWDTVHDIVTNKWRGFKEFAKYMLFGTGLFLSPIPQIIIYARTALLDTEGRTESNSPEELDGHIPANIPDFEIMVIPHMSAYPESDDLGVPLSEGPTSYLCALLRPESTGTVRLKSRDPRERPACDLNVFSSPHDMAVLRRGLRLPLGMTRTIRKRGAHWKDMLVPASSSDADLDAHIRKHSQTTFHYSSTCRMAPEAELGVVDDELRVYGVQGLRIADASIFPSIPACHLQAPVVMIGERCADFVLKARKGI